MTKLDDSSVKKIKNCLKIEKLFENKEKEKNRCAGLS